MKRKVSAVISKGNSLFNSAQNLENQVTILFMTEDDILNKSRTTMNNCLSTITDLRTSHYKIREDFDELNEITELSEYKTNCSSMEKKDKQVQIQLEQTYKLLKSTTDQINQEREKNGFNLVKSKELSIASPVDMPFLWLIFVLSVALKVR